MPQDFSSRFGLSFVTLGKLLSVFKCQPAIDQVIIFGSRAKGNYRHGSDIDLAIKGQQLTFNQLMQLQNQIDDLNMPYTVDLIQYDQLGNQELVAHIDRVGIVIYDKSIET